MKVLVIGSGTMGSGIAEAIASSGTEVFLNDINDTILASGISKITKNLSKLVSKEKITEEQKTSILNNIKPTVNLLECADVDLVIEAASENMEIKKSIFKGVTEAVNENALLCTNTSSLSITEIAQISKRPDKFIGLHFFNPAQVMKLVEVIKGVATSDDTVKIVVDFVKKINKEPVLVEEAPGFVVNRILIPMINEAIGVYSENIASKEDIDKAMMLGCNHPIGPLSLADLIGLDVVLAIMEVLYKEFGDQKYAPHPTLKKMVRANLLGRKTGRGFYQYD